MLCKRNGCWHAFISFVVNAGKIIGDRYNNNNKVIIINVHLFLSCILLYYFITTITIKTHGK